MELSQIFYVSVYTLACLSGGMLAWAEGDFLPAGLTIPIGIAAYSLNEKWRWIRLSGVWVNTLALVAFIYPAIEFFSDNPEGRLLAGAHLLVLLQWIVFLQDKQTQQYWWIFALSILQVAVSAVLTRSGLFGILLIVYLLSAMWSLSVFSLYLGTERFHEGEDVPENSLETAHLPLLRHPLAVAGTGGIPMLELGRRNPSIFTNAAQKPQGGGWINGRFAGGIVGMTVAALCIGFGFFLLIPRYWIGGITFRAQGTQEPGVQPLSGFSERVTLGDFGQILESPAGVLKVTFTDNDTKERVDIAAHAAAFGMEEPLFTGTVLVHYNGKGRWSPPSPKREDPLKDTYPGSYLRQIYQLEPIGTNVLFVMRPLDSKTGARMDGGGPVLRKVDTAQLCQESRELTKALKYTVYTPRYPGEQVGREKLSVDHRHDTLAIPAKGLERLQELAVQVTDSAVPAGQRRPLLDMEKARRIESYLRDSGEFQYSLDARITDASIDPVEDFLFKRKAGHCEYFASALTLMLRSVDIPARLVTGFKGGIVNRQKEFEIQQRHAHAWVEAYIKEQEKWVVFDATPAAARQAVVEQSSGVGAWWNAFRRVFTDFWQNYVFNMSLSRQEELLYAPFKNAVANGVASSSFRANISMLLRGAMDFLLSPAQWISMRGGLIAITVLLTSAFGYGFLHLFRQFRIRFGNRRRHSRRSGEVQVDFYETFAKIMETQGFARNDAQTQREFAGEVQTKINAQLQAHGLAQLPAELSDAFYRVRFGWNRLSATEHGRLLAQLQRLEACLGVKPEKQTSR